MEERKGKGGVQLEMVMEEEKKEEVIMGIRRRGK